MAEMLPLAFKAVKRRAESVLARRWRRQGLLGNDIEPRAKIRIEETIKSCGHDLADDLQVLQACACFPDAEILKG